MLDVSNLYPIRSSYTLTFNDTLGSLMVDSPDYYWCWAEFMFEHLQDVLLSDRYLLIVSQMKYNRIEYLNELINDIYNESVETACDEVDMCEEDNPGVYTTAHIHHEYLDGNETQVKWIMLNIANSIVFNIFHPLHHFTISAANAGVKFSNFSLNRSFGGMCLNVACTTSMEVIKQHDNNWYDRLSLLAPF